MNRRRLRPRARLSDDTYLKPFLPSIEARYRQASSMEQVLTEGRMTLAEFASGHEYFGLHRTANGWVFREWAPNALAVFLVGDFSGWQESDMYLLRKTGGDGVWEIDLPADTLRHGDLYKLRLHWPGGNGERIPAYARRVVQDSGTHIFSAQVWHPETPYAWRHASPVGDIDVPLIYEAHVGMALEWGRVGTYLEFAEHILPRIADAGYNTVQLMAIMEHPYYGSFGYHVANFFAATSRFGTPDELKGLVDEAHGRGLAVIMDLVHSHAVRNELEGLSRFDGTPYQYFHQGGRGDHAAWDSRCFDYGKLQVVHFLLSNCRFWLDEYHFDGYRLDGVTSMLYHHHGLGEGFGSYGDYFGGVTDEDAVTYLMLANKVIHAVRPDAITIAEDVSGMPGLGAPVEDGGCGFDYRLAMGVPDCWFKLFKMRDDDWPMNYLWHELTNRRQDERTVNYVESHDQALVGGKTAIFELIDASMYTGMGKPDQDLLVDRGIALHKMARLATVGTAGHGYLNFMGNEFGHPEWIDFPREGNGWSYHYCRRQWSLRDNPELKYHFLADFDRAMINLIKESGALATHDPECLKIHTEDHVMAFMRGDLVFLFNFHPVRSQTDYPVDAPEGAYALVLDTDELRFGGQGRIAAEQCFVSRISKAAPDAQQAAVCDTGEDRRKKSSSAPPPHPCLSVYLPARSAMLLRRCG